MSLSSLERVGDAIDTTRSFLIPPSLARWSKLALLVVFFGTAGTPIPASPQLLDPRIWRGPTEGPAADNETAENETAENETTADLVGGADEEEIAGSEADLEALLDGVDLSALLPVLVGIVAVVGLLAVAYFFVGIVFRFAFVESLRSREVRLRQYSGRHLRRAVGVFVLQVTFILLALPAVAGAVIVASPFGPVQFGFAGAAIVALLALAWSAMLVIAYALTQQFVVPVMVKRECGVLAGWRRLWPTLTEEYVEYVAFGFVRFGLGIAVGIVAAIALVVTAVVFLIVFGTVGAAVVLVAGSPVASATSAIALGLLALAFLGCLLVAFAYINVPFQTYLWYYSLLVLGDIDHGLDLIPEQRAAAESDQTGVFGG